MRILCESLIVLALLAAPSAAFASMGPDPDRQWEGAFDYAIVGGTVLVDNCTRDAFSGACNPPGGDLQGDAVVDWPNIAEMYGVPYDATVEYAELIWMASNTPDTAVDNTVTFQAPAGDFIDLTADAVNNCQSVVERNVNIGSLASPEYADFMAYTCRVDITELLRDHVDVRNRPLNGSWNFGHLAASTARQYIMTTGVVGAWAVMIVYQSQDIARKRLYLYEGFEQAQCERIELTPTGFEVPKNPAAKITYFVGEGDATISGTGISGCTVSEGLWFNYLQLGDTCNFLDNPFNSTRSTNIDPGVGDCEVNVFSLDLDTFHVGDLLHEGDTYAKVFFDLGQDQIYTNFLMLSIDTKLPSFDIPNLPEKTASVEDGGYVSPGDQFEYKIRVENHGEDLARHVVVQDEIPEYTEYVCNSTFIKGPDDVETPVADRDDCICPLTGVGVVVTESMPVGSAAGYTLRFSVRLLGEDAGVTKETLIYNEAKISSLGNADVYVTNGGIPVRLRVQLRSYEGKLNIEHGEADPSDGFAFPGDSNVTVAQIKLSSRDGDVSFKSVAFDAVGSADDLADIREVRLYWDVDADGVATPSDTLIGTRTFPQDNGRIRFDNVGKVITSGQVYYLVLAYDLGATLTAGKSFGVTIAQSGGVDLRGFIADGCLPFESSTFTVPQGDLLAYLGNANPVGGNVAPGAVFDIMQLVVRSVSGAYSLDGLTVNLSGNIGDHQVAPVRLYLDADKNGRSAGDTLLGELP